MSAIVTPYAPRRSMARAVLQDRVAITWDRFTLPNGLTVIVHENRAVPLVTVNIWYKVGSKDEPAGKTGLAHLFEHLMFGGSANMPGSYLDYMQRFGPVDINGTTNPDRTNFYQTIGTNALDVALFAESDRMGHFLETLNADVFEQQRRVVLNEKDQTESGPSGWMQECVARRLYPAEHPYAHTTIGWREDIEGLTLDDARSWFRKHYAPSNAVLVLAGDIDLETARAKTITFFGDIPPGPPQQRPGRWIPAPRGERRHVVEDRVPHAVIRMVWNVPPAGDNDATLLSLARNTLGGGAYSRLHNRLVERDGLALDVSAKLVAMMLSGQVVISVTLAEGADIAALDEAIRNELARFCREGMTEDELERIRINGEAEMIRDLQTSQSVADQLAMNEVFFGDPSRYQAEMEWIAGATAEEVRGAVTTWLDRAPDLSVHTVPYGVLRPDGEGVVRSQLPLPGPLGGIAPPPMQEARLANGMRVIVAERHDLPLIECKLIVPRGATLEPRDRLGSTALVAALMGEGAGKRDRAAFHDAMELNAIDISAGIGFDFSNARVSTLRSRLPLALELYADMIRRPRFDRGSLDRLRGQRLVGIRGSDAAPTPDALMNRLLPGLMFGPDHRYALPLGGRADTLAAVTGDDLGNLHRRIFDPAGATLIVVGDTTMQETLPTLEAQYGDWAPSLAANASSVDPAKTAEPGIYLIDIPGAAQTSIAAATMIPPRSEIDPIALIIVDMVLGGTFGSRLNMNLREDKNWTYGVRTQIGGTRGERTYITTGAFQADRTGDSMIEIAREFADLVTDRRITPETLAAMQQTLIQGLPEEIQTIGSLMTAIDTIVQHGHPLDYFSSLAERIRAIDLDQVNALARRIISPDKLIWVVAGDRASIEADLVRTRLGPVQLVKPASDRSSR